MFNTIMNVPPPLYIKQLLPLILIAGCLYGCSENGDENVSSRSENQILHLGNGDEPQDLDPHVVTGVPEHKIITALIEGLVGKDPVDLKPEAAVAESWEISPDNLVYTFNLRSNAKWSNGDPVTAQDFIYSWKRALMPALGNQYAYMLYPVKNAEQFHKGEVEDFAEVGVRAINDKTLEVELNHSTPYFLGLLDHYSTFPVHQETVEKFGEIDSRGTRWTRTENFVGNGPFILKTWEQNRIIAVEKNPLYWDAEKVKLDEIHFHPVQTVTTEERMFRSGQLHITNSVPDAKIAVYMRDDPELIMISPYLGTYFYRFNTTLPGISDERVRKALAMTIDRESIVKNITKGGQIPAYTLTPPDTLGYTAESDELYDINKARQLMTEAGYPNGEGFPTIELLYNTSEGHRKIALAIQQMWKQALNIDISLHNQDWKVFLDRERTMDFQITRASWIGDYVDPNTFLDMFITDGGNNKTGWSNREYDELIALAAATGDQAKRYELFQQAESILMEAMPIIPIYTYTKSTLISPKVKGWHSNILDHHPYKYVYLEDQATQH